MKPGWNTYEIQAIGSKIRTWINGHPCVDLEDTGGAAAAFSHCNSTPAAQPKCGTRILRLS